jgi:hypothetical protein
MLNALSWHLNAFSIHHSLFCIPLLRDLRASVVCKIHVLEVDAIFDKISREGMGSLTPAEREVLDRASQAKRGESES